MGINYLGRFEDLDMKTFKLRLRFEEFEFDAEGDQDIVERNLNRFLELIAPAISLIGRGKSSTLPNDALNLNAVLSLNDRGVFVLDEHSERVISHGEALLLFLKAYQVYKLQKFVRSSNIRRCAEASGLRLVRLDRIMIRYMNQGWAMRIGERSGTEYGLTESGSEEVDRIIRIAVAGN